MKGVVTPTHFDEAFNLFTQIRGRKRFKLYSPKYFANLYPYPVHHPCDRQAQVDIDNPDLIRFPKFSAAKGVETIVEPGDVLYLPPYWFHHVVSLDKSISVNFWFVMPNDKLEPLQLPIKDQSRIMALRRNIEKFIGDAMGGAAVGKFLEELFTDRFNVEQIQLSNAT